MKKYPLKSIEYCYNINEENEYKNEKNFLGIVIKNVPDRMMKEICVQYLE